MDQQLRRFVLAFLLFLMSILIGIIGFVLLEDYNLIDAFYMSIITLSTVGFTEVRELSAEGRLFTSFYIILNLGIFAFIVSVFSSYLFEGKLKSIFKGYMSERGISRLKNHVIVCGYGRNGGRACEELLASGMSFVVLDKDPLVTHQIPKHHKFELIIADATVDENLILAGIERAKVVIIATPSDASNVFITLTARALNPSVLIISRASEHHTESKLYRAGANKVIMPDNLGGMYMAQLVTKPVVVEFLDLLNGVSGTSFHMEEVGYEYLKEEFRDKTLKELNILDRTGATVVGIKDNIKGLIPSPTLDTFMGVDDTLILLGSNEHMKKFRSIFMNEVDDFFNYQNIN